MAVSLFLSESPKRSCSCSLKSTDDDRPRLNQSRPVHPAKGEQLCTYEVQEWSCVDQFLETAFVKGVSKPRRNDPHHRRKTRQTTLGLSTESIVAYGNSSRCEPSPQSLWQMKDVHVQDQPGASNQNKQRVLRFCVTWKLRILEETFTYKLHMMCTALRQEGSFLAFYRQEGRSAMDTTRHPHYPFEFASCSEELSILPQRPRMGGSNFPAPLNTCKSCNRLYEEYTHHPRTLVANSPSSHDQHRKTNECCTPNGTQCARRSPKNHIPYVCVTTFYPIFSSSGKQQTTIYRSAHSQCVGTCPLDTPSKCT